MRSDDHLSTSVTATHAVNRIVTPMRRRLVLSIIDLNGLAVAADVSSGSATAHPGQRATGFVQVPAGVDVGTRVPVIVVNGRTSAARRKRWPVLLNSRRHGKFDHRRHGAKVKTRGRKGFVGVMLLDRHTSAACR